MTTITTTETIDPQQLEALDTLTAHGEVAFQPGAPEGVPDAGLAAATATHRVAWIGGLVAHPTGGVGIDVTMRSLSDGSTVRCRGRLTGTGLALLGSGGFGEIYIDPAEFKRRKIWVAVGIVPGGPGWLPTMWATFWDGHQKVGFIGGAAAGITFPGYGNGFVESI